VENKAEKEVSRSQFACPEMSRIIMVSSHLKYIPHLKGLES